MSFLEREICHYTETIWNTLLGRTANLEPNASLPPEDDLMVCSVDISGSWTGTVAMHFPVTLARKTAACMFDQSPENISPDQIQSALNELGNMTAGNIKALLEDPCKLSLPTIKNGKDYPLNSDQNESICPYMFRCMGSTFAVSVRNKGSDVPHLAH